MVKVELLKELDNGIRFYSMENEVLKLVVVNMGCRIMEILAPDASGKRSDVILGLKNIEDYANDPAYFGAIIGRVANRIGDARFSLNGKTYELYANNGKNHLHGGKEGFDKKIFDVTPLENGLRFHYLSKDGEEGYPGNLNLYVTYTLDDNTFSIHYEADTDADTVVNFTNHLYFNLSNTLEKVTEHSLQINADYIGCVDALYTGNDNTIASAMATYTDAAYAKKIPIYCGADSMVADGGFATVGVNYVQLGKQVADMVEKIVNGEKPSDIPYETISDYAKYVNMQAVKQFGGNFDKKAFEGFDVLVEEDGTSHFNK